MEQKENYRRQDIYDAERIEKLSYHYREILSLLGEDPTREGLLKTPERVAKAMAFITDSPCCGVLRPTAAGAGASYGTDTRLHTACP